MLTWLLLYLAIFVNTITMLNILTDVFFMCLKNDAVDFISEYVIIQIPGEGKTLLNSIPNDQAALYPT